MSWITAMQAMEYFPWIISAAAAAAAVLPKSEPGTAWDTIRKGIDFAAMNFGNAKNMSKK